MDFQPPYLPPPPPDFLAPSPGLVSPPGLQPRPFQYPQMCPGLPVHVLQEHQQLLERVSSQQGQLHRLLLELGAVHYRFMENGDLLAQLDDRLEALEFKGSEDQRRTDKSLSAMALDLEDGRSLLAQVSAGLLDLQQQPQQQSPPPRPQAPGHRQVTGQGRRAAPAVPPS